MLAHRRTFVLFVVTTAVLCLHVCIVSQKAVAQNSAGTVSNVGTSSGAFLEIGVGARAQAMGGAYVALANDVSAMYWNPAGISRLDRIEVMFTFSDWLVDTRHTYAGIVFPLGGVGAIGANVTSFGMPDQPVRAIGQEEGTGEFYSAGDFALGISFAYNFTDRFSLGISTKYINERIWHTSANGFALDIGALYQTQWQGLRMGFSLSNFGTNLQLSGRDLLNAVDPDKNNSGVENINVNYSTGEFPLPLIFRFGLSKQFEVITEQHRITFSADVSHPSNNVESINIGLEYMLYKMIAMRAGYESLFDKNSINGLTFGLGISADFYGGIGTYFDYAYADWGVFNAVHRLSLRMTF
jgi:long-subunit fatty acid transport protein